MRFSQVARIHETLLLGGSKRAALSSISEREEAVQIYNLFFPSSSIVSKGDLTALFAKEVGVFVDVVYDVLQENSLAHSLAQESSGSTSQGWSVKDALAMMELLKVGSISLLDVSHKMDEMEARLFWRHIVGEQAPISPRSYVICLGVNEHIPIDVMKKHVATKDNQELINTIYNDPLSIDAPFRWHEEPNLALTPRRYKPFHPHDDIQEITEYNGGVYQRILSKGSTKMLYVLSEPNGTRLVWRDRSGRITSGGIAPNDEWLPKGPIILETTTNDGVIHVYDVILPRHPVYPMKDRLNVLSEHIAAFPDAPLIVHHPFKIGKMSELVSSIASEEIIRMPDIGAFDPFNSGGFVLMANQAKAVLRLHAIRKASSDELEVKISSLDGFEDFIEVGTTFVTGDIRNHLQQTVSRLASIVIDKQWQEIDSDIVIPLDMIIASVSDKMVQESHILGIRDDLGISDITQYVDLLHGSDD